MASFNYTSWIEPIYGPHATKKTGPFLTLHSIVIWYPSLDHQERGFKLP